MSNLRIYEKHDSIKKYLKDLEELNITLIKDLEIKEKYYASSMIVFSILNDFFVLGDEIIEELGLEIAQTYKEIFKILEKNNVISKEDFNYCKKITYLRNKLAHEYEQINLDELFELITNIKNVNKIIEKCLNALKLDKLK